MSGKWFVFMMDAGMVKGSPFETKALAIDAIAGRHLGRGRVIRIRGGYYEHRPLTDQDSQPSYYICTREIAEKEWSHYIGGET